MRLWDTRDTPLNGDVHTGGEWLPLPLSHFTVAGAYARRVDYTFLVEEGAREK